MNRETSHITNSFITSNKLLDIEKQRKLFFIKYSYILLNVILFGFVIINYYSKAYQRATIEAIILLCSLIALAINIIFKKHGILEVVILSIVIILFSYLYLDGPNSAIWILTFPAMAFFVQGQKWGTVLTTTVGAIMLVLYAYDSFRPTPALEDDFKLRLFILYISLSGLIFLFEQSRYTSYIGLKKMASMVVEEEEKLHTILSTSDPIIFATDKNGTIELLKGKSLESINLTEKSCRGLPLSSTLCGCSNIEEQINEAILGETIRKEIEICDRIFDTVFTPWKNHDGKIIGVIGMALDITEKQNIHRQLETARKMEAIGKLAGGIAHDFNNMLGAISGYAELIQKKFSGTDEKLDKYIEHILSATEHSSDLVYKLLAFSRKGAFQSGPVDLHGTIVDVIELLEETRGKGIKITKKLLAENFTIIGDHSQLQNAFMNLAINAIDAMPNGGELIFESSEFYIDKEFLQKKPYQLPEGKYIEIRISDTGTGINNEILEKIFEPFFTTKETGKGTGLGLASVYGSIKSHGGAIDVTSIITKGTTFNIYIPLKTI